MIQQIGQALIFDALFISNKVGKTGLTVTVDIWRGTTEIVTGGSASELGDGLYYYTLSAGSVTQAGHYRAVFKTADTTVDQQHIAALWIVGTTWVENLNAAISSVAASVWSYSSRTLTQTLASILASISGTAISQVKGDRWSISATITAFTWDSGAVLRFTAKRVDGFDSIPDSGADIQIRKSVAGTGDGLIYLKGAAASDPTDGSITVVSAAAGTVTLAVHEDATSVLPIGTYKYDFKLYRPSAGTLTLAQGMLTVQPTITKALT